MLNADADFYGLDDDVPVATAEADEIYFGLDVDEGSGVVHERVLRAGSHDATYYDLDDEQPSSSDDYI